MNQITQDSKPVIWEGALACLAYPISEHVTCAFVQEIGEQAAHDSLMTDDQNIALSLQLHDHWLQPLNQVLIGLWREECLHIESNERGPFSFTFFSLLHQKIFD